MVALGLAMLVITSEMTITAVVLLAYALPMAALAMTVGPAVVALSWTVAGGGPPDSAPVLVLTAAALAGLLTLLAPARRPAGAGAGVVTRPPPAHDAVAPGHDLVNHSGRNLSCSKIVSSSR